MSAAVYMVQRDFAVGDLAGNRRKLLDAAVRAQQCGAAVLLSPELSLTGYCPEDMLYNPAFMDDVAREWQPSSPRRRPIWQFWRACHGAIAIMAKSTTPPP